jgi:hypothetical protein
MPYLDDVDVRNEVKKYVKATGMYKDAYIIAGYKDRSGFEKYLKKHPDFQKELQKIKHYSDLTTDAELIEGAYKAVRNNILHGTCRIIEDINPKTGEVTNKRTVKTGPSKWAIEKVNPPLLFVEEALKMVIASLVKSISDTQDLSEEIKQSFYRHLDKFHRDELISLVQRGKRLKDTNDL